MEIAERQVAKLEGEVKRLRHREAELTNQRWFARKTGGVFTGSKELARLWMPLSLAESHLLGARIDVSVLKKMLAELNGAGDG